MISVGLAGTNERTEGGIVHRRISNISAAALVAVAIAVGTWQIVAVRSDLSKTRSQMQTALNGRSKSGLVATQIVESVVIAKLQIEMAAEVKLLASMESQISVDGSMANNALAISQSLESSVSSMTQDVSAFNMFIGCVRTSGGNPYSLTNC